MELFNGVLGKVVKSCVLTAVDDDEEWTMYFTDGSRLVINSQAYAYSNSGLSGEYITPPKET